MKGEILSESQLDQLQPMRGEGGRTWRVFCPFHGSDKQRSLRVDRQTGRFQCFACEAWGYMDWAREEFRQNKRTQLSSQPLSSRSFALPRPASPRPAPAPVLENIAALLAEYQAALPGSLGEEYLAERGIPLPLAQSFGLGYSAPGRWAHRNANGRPVRDWQFGRLVFPHTTPAGEIVNLYGRAVGDRVPKELRHDHLPGAKGYFHAEALHSSEVYVCEGPFDALSLYAAIPSSAVVAIFGVQGWRQDWCANVRRIIFALDTDPAGQSAWRKLARQLALRGKQVRVLPPEAFGVAKDLNEAWVAGSLQIDKTY